MAQAPDLVHRTRVLAKAVLLGAVALVTSRATYRGVARWHLRTKNLVKIILGAIMLVLGLATLLILT